MISQFLQSRIVSEKTGWLVAQAVVFASAVLIVGSAFIKMMAMHLTETQWLVGLAIVSALVLQCLILLALIDLKRKWVEPQPGADPNQPLRSL